MIEWTDKGSSHIERPLDSPLPGKAGASPSGRPFAVPANAACQGSLVRSVIVLKPRPFPETRASLLSAMRGTGRETAWREFFARYAPPVFRVARQRGLDADDAEDVVQQVMISLSQHLSDFRYDRDRGRFRGWVQSITTNKVHDRMRGEKRRGDVAAFQFDEDRDSPTDETESALWAQEWLLQDTLWCLEQVRGEIAPHRYEAFRLYAVEGVAPAAIAERLGMTLGNVYVTRSQIAKRIRDLMASLNESKSPPS